TTSTTTSTTTSDRPWTGDAVSLVEAFRSGERSPVEELEATYAAIDASDLNAISHTDRDAAFAAASSADVSLPFGGVPIGAKELNHIEGWPATEASVALSDRISGHTDTMFTRLTAAGAVLAAQTTASEFGATNQTSTDLHGVTRNPWNLDRTPGGSSGGSSAGVAGGLFTIASGSDGGGSVRIPAGFCGLVGLKATFGRTPMGPKVGPGNLTVVFGCQARSVRDTARWFDVTNGFDPRDPLSLPRVEGWEVGLGSHADDLRALRVAVLPEFGGSVVADETMEVVSEAGAWLIDLLGMRRRDVEPALPRTGGTWGITGAVFVRQIIGDRWPECADGLSGSMRAGMAATIERYNVDVAIQAENSRIELNEAMADLFEQVDLVIAPTNPDVAFGAEGRLPRTFGGKESTAANNGTLTIPSNIYGNPAISIPMGTGADGLPIGLQVIGPHFSEELLLDVALAVERERPWPLIAPAGGQRGRVRSNL
ncbi:MAG: amidase, partial [Ilumatobacteraceae bacterium]